jgi:phosphate transport system substrate-binding protein
MERTTKPARLAAVVALAAIALGACSSGGTPVTPGSAGGGAKTLTGAGATFPAPLYQKWADEYNKAKGVQINYQAIGSGGGVQQIIAKTVDFGASDAPMKDEELASAPGPILHIPTVFGAVVVTYNLSGVTAPLKFKPATIASIFLGDVKKWNDAAIKADNPGVTLPSEAISIVHRSDGSGTTSVFTNFLTLSSDKWSKKVGAGKEVEWPAGTGGKGNDGVAALVKQTPGAVGYVEVAFAKKNGMAAAEVENKAGKFVAATLESITAAAASVQPPDDLRFSVLNAPGDTAYPISSATWLLVYKDQADKSKGTALVNFLWWAIHDGQQFAPDLIYAPLPQSLVTAAEAKIKTIDFNGTPLYAA